MSDYVCPYDGQGCKEFLKQLLRFKQEVSGLSESNSRTIFFEPGTVFSQNCPLNIAERNECIRYKSWQQKERNE